MPKRRFMYVSTCVVSLSFLLQSLLCGLSEKEREREKVLQDTQSES